MFLEIQSTINNIPDMPTAGKALSKHLGNEFRKLFPEDLEPGSIIIDMGSGNVEKICKMYAFPKLALAAAGSIVAKSSSNVLKSLGQDVYNSIEKDEISTLTYIRSEDVELKMKEFTLPFITHYNEKDWRDILTAGYQNNDIVLFIPFNLFEAIAYGQENSIEELIGEAARIGAEMRLLELDNRARARLPIGEILSQVRQRAITEYRGLMNPDLEKEFGLEGFEQALGIVSQSGYVS